MGRRFAYADPPYLGCAQRYYGDKHPDAAAYDRIGTHAALITRLVHEFPDGWALSCHVPSLAIMLTLCPKDVRIAAWVKPFSGVRPGVRARFSWEPVIFRASVAWAHGPMFADHLVDDAPRNNGVDRGGFPGKKSEAFAAWIARMLGARPDDELVDLFPGSGQVSRAFKKPRDPRSFQLELVEQPHAA